MKKTQGLLLGIIIIIVIIVASIFLSRPKDAIDNMDDIENDPIYIKETDDKEEMIMQIVALDDKDEYLKKALELFPDLDFDKIEDVYGEASVLKILEWLSRQDIESQEDMIILIDMMDDFHGEEYHKLTESMANAYLGDKITFIKALAKSPDKINQVALALYDLSIYDQSSQELFNDLEMIINSEELTDEERDIGVALLSRYSECGT